MLCRLGAALLTAALAAVFTPDAATGREVAASLRASDPRVVEPYGGPLEGRRECATCV